MPKTLLIMRHAKSSWKQPGLTDYQRPLNKRGLADTPRMAEFLLAQQLVPQHIFHSSANRTTTTAGILVKQFRTLDSNVTPTVSSHEELYLARWQVYVELLAQQFAADHDIAMVLGHNPGVEDLVEALTGQYVTMPTAAIAHCSIEIDSWQQISGSSKKKTKLNDLWTPKGI